MGPNPWRMAVCDHEAIVVETEKDKRGPIVTISNWAGAQDALAWLQAISTITSHCRALNKEVQRIEGKKAEGEQYLQYGTVDNLPHLAQILVN